jgi:membrane-associated phospholipid phosphatase
MKLSTWITPLIVVALLLAGCLAPASGAPVEPQAGQWQTWVLTASDEVQPPAPPDPAATLTELAELKTLVSQRDAIAQAQVAYWDAGSPSYRWVQIALDQFKSKPVTNPRVARGMSLMNVAIYDALVAAWDAKYTYNRPRPTQTDPTLTTLVAVPNSPAYPAEHAVVAGAAAAILGYLYPDDAATFQAKADEAAHSRVLAGVQYPSDVEAGLALGQQVAQRVLARAQADGSDAEWDGTMPTAAGHWTGEKPIEPLAASWQAWVLTSTSELRPPPPPAYDSPELAAELREIQTFTRTWQTNQKALYWQTFDSIFPTWYQDAGRLIFEHQLDSNPPRAAQIYAAMSVAQYDAILACWDAKYTYWSIRPFHLDPELTTLFPTPNHPSYPSSHSCDASAIAAVLEHFFPAEAEVIHAKADEAGESRLWAGIHFRSDIEAGLALGRAVAQKVIEQVAAMTPKSGL